MKSFGKEQRFVEYFVKCVTLFTPLKQETVIQTMDERVRNSRVCVVTEAWFKANCDSIL